MKRKLLDGLEGLSKPGEKAAIEFSRNPLNELKASYQCWTSLIRDIKEKDMFPFADFYIDAKLGLGKRLYEEAMLLTQHLPKGISSAELMELVYERSGVDTLDYSGLYLTSLLNNSCLEEIIVDRMPLSFLGFKLSKGKLKINCDSRDFIGAYGNGGLVENYGKIHSLLAVGNVWGGSFGRFGSGIACVNYGDANNIGNSAKGGTYKNYGQCLLDGIMGENAEDGIYLNYNSIKEIGPYARGGFFYNGGYAHRMARYAKHGFFLNNSAILDSFAEDADDGFYFNNGRVKKFGFGVRDGLYANCGEAKYLATFARQGIFVVKKRGGRNFQGAMREVTKVGWLRLFFNPQLNDYMNSIRTWLNNKDLDINNIKRQLILSKENCVRNYVT